MHKHLQAVHAAEAAHHIVKSKHHLALHEEFSKLAEHFGKSALGDAHPEAGECLKNIAALHQSAAAHHTAQAQRHIEHAKAVPGNATHKAAGMDNGDTVEPLPAGLARVAPDVPFLRAIPRHGMQPLPAAETADPVFKTIFGDGAEGSDV